MSSTLVVESPMRRDVSEIPEVAVTDLLLEQLRARLPGLGDKPWVVDVTSGTQVKFCDVESQSRRVASALSRRGFKKGHVLYFVTYEMAQLNVVHLAVWRLGGVVQGSYPDEQTAEYVRQMRETSSQFVLVDAETVPKLQEATASLEWPVVLLSVGDVTVPGTTSFSQLLEDDGTAFPEKVAINPREDVVVIPSTSGSTGKSKGVLHTHYTAVAFVMSTRDCFDLGPSVMSLMVNFAIGNFMVTLMSLYQGSTIYNISKFDENNYLNLLRKYKPRMAMMYPYLATWFSRHPDLERVDLSFLDSIWMGAWVLDPATVALFTSRLPNVKLVQAYGMTECMAISITALRKDADDPEAPFLNIVENQGEQCVSTGRLLPYVQAKIIDPVSGRSLDRGKRGEILVHSPCIMKGYLSPGQAPNRAGIDELGWLHTGDLGFIDEDGNIIVLERVNFTFKFKAEIVSPSEIEAVLQEHAAVLGAGVVGVPHPETDCLSRAMVVLRPNCSATADELQNYVASRLSYYKQLHGGVRFIQKLPQNRAGKLDRTALKKLALLEEEKGSIV